MRGRIRTIKPEVFSDEVLGDLEQRTGLPVFRVFVGLWCFADREGRFEWSPRALRGAIMPCWDGDMAGALEALASKSYIIRYTVRGRDYGCIRSFSKHQQVNSREAKSVLPSPTEHCTETPVHSHEAPTEPVTGKSVGNETSGVETRGEREGTSGARVALPGPDNLTEPQTYTFIPDWWTVSDEFASEALAAGVTRPILDEDVTYWRGRKLGGEWRSIEQFFRAHFPRLAKRRETEAFKATKHASAQPNAGKTGWE